MSLPRGTTGADEARPRCNVMTKPDRNKTTLHKTFCGICSSGTTHCGIDATVQDGLLVRVDGMKEHPANEGTLCVKGASSCQYVYNSRRLRHPMKRVGERGSGQWKRISWDEALDTIADRLLQVKATDGPESVIFFCGYVKWLRPYLQRFAHLFGSPNFNTESSLCQSATVVATSLNFGCFGGPDVPHTRCILSWSNNPCHSNPQFSRLLLDAKEAGVKLITVDPRLSAWAEKADLHLQPRPGTDGALALGMIHTLIEEHLYDQDFVSRWTLGFDDLRKYVAAFSPEEVEKITRVPASKIIEAARLFGTIRPACLLTSACATTHHTNGVQNHRAITLLMALTGNFDVRGGNVVKPGGYLYTASGIPTDEEKVRMSDRLEALPPRIGLDRLPIWCRFYPESNSMVIPFQIQSGKPYPLKALIGFGANYRMWPASDFLKQSLLKLDFLVFVDFFMTDTCEFGDILLPAATHFERSELKHWDAHYVMLTHPVIQPLGEAWSDAKIIMELAKKVGLGEQFWNGNFDASVDEIMRPSGYTSESLRRHPSGLRVDNFLPVEYKKYEKEGFPTPSGKVEISSSLLKDHGWDPLPAYTEPEHSPRSRPDLAKEYPLILNTGSRLPMFIHSEMYNVPWCRELRPEPLLDMNPDDAGKRGIREGDPVFLETPRNRIRVKAHLTETVLPGVVHMPHGMKEADVNLLIEPDYIDPISGFPGFRSLLCEVKPGGG
jgi:anaerobic selenocysteine-containing dehydrogenase